MRSPRPQWQINIVNYLLENIFDFFTIAAALFVFIRHQFYPFGPNEVTDLLSWILGILGLLAVSGLWERHRQLKAIEKLALETNEIVATKLGGRVRASDFFWENDKKITDADLANVTEFYLVGMILNRTVRNHMSILGDRVAAGANLRFVLLDYEDESLMKVLPIRSYGSKASQWWQSRIQQTVGHIEDITNSDSPTGSIKIGLLPYFPSFGMWLIDPDKPKGKIIVEIYHHRTAEPNGTFSLSASDDSYWYSFYRKQFDLLWESCKESGKIISVVPKSQSTTPPGENRKRPNS